MVDEYLTSQICPICQTRTTQKTLDNDNYQIHSVLNCSTCLTQWNRDHMASINIRSVFLHMARNNNERPAPFQRGYVIFLSIKMNYYSTVYFIGIHNIVGSIHYVYYNK